MKPSFTTEGPAGVLAASSVAASAADVANEALAQKEGNTKLSDGSVYVGQTRHNDLCDIQFHVLGRKGHFKTAPILLPIPVLSHFDHF
jgi:hypothetical protein